MDNQFFGEIAAGLTAVFTGLTGYVTLKLYRDQKAQRLPAVFLRCEPYDNGCIIRVTVRNRADHPMRVTEISVINYSRIGLAQKVGSSYAHSGHPPTKVVRGRLPAKRSWDVDMTLTSSNRDGDSGYREFILCSVNPPPYIEIEIKYDPSDDSDKILSIRRKLKFSRIQFESISNPNSLI